MSTTACQTQATVLSMWVNADERGAPGGQTECGAFRHRSRGVEAHCDLRGIIVMVRSIRYADSRCSDRVAGGN